MLASHFLSLGPTITVYPPSELDPGDRVGHRFSGMSDVTPLTERGFRQAKCVFLARAAVPSASVKDTILGSQSAGILGQNSHGHPVPYLVRGQRAIVLVKPPI